MSDVTVVQAARLALEAAMREDGTVVVLGEDVSSGGPFGLTKGLIDEFGASRVRNTPISESAFMGVGIGLALAGARPLVDVMFNDFLTAASDQLFNHAAKIHYLSSGRYSVPLTTWTVGGAGTRWGAQHSQRLDGWLVQVPGLKVLAPASPELAASSLRAALAEPDPVVVLCDRSLLYSRAPLRGDDASPWRARVVREGTDVTVATTGRLVHLALAVSSTLPISVEVIDLQCLSPLDIETVCTSVMKTSRLVIAHDEVANGGLIALLAKAVYEEAFWYLDGPIRQVTSPSLPVPAAPTLEDDYVVDAEEIRRAILQSRG